MTALKDNVIDLQPLPSIAVVFELIANAPLEGEQNGDEVRARCLMEKHDDSNPSCNYNVKKDLFHCFSCNEGGGILALIVGAGLAADRQGATKWMTTVGLRTVKTTDGLWHSVDHIYVYVDIDGTPVYDVGRWDNPKTFRQRAYKADGKYNAGKDALKGVTRYPYRLTQLLRACDVGETIYVVEGEKDADRLVVDGLAATTNAQGAAWTWPVDWAEYFRGAGRAVVIADNDEAGRKAAQQRAAIIARAVPDTRIILAMPGVGDKGDVSDWLDSGGTADALRALADAAPVATAYEAPYSPAALAALVANLNDTGNGHFFAETVGRDYLWVAEEEHGKWYAYSGGIWSPNGANTTAATQQAVTLMKQALDDGDVPESASHVDRSTSHLAHRHMLEEAKARLTRSPSLFNRDGSLLPVANGTLDLRTGTLREHRRGDYITFKSPVAYDPTATCPRFEQLLDEATALPDGTLRPHLREYLELILAGALEARTTQRRCFFFFGPKGTMKSTIIRTMHSILGNFSTDISYNLLSEAKFASDGQSASPATMRLQDRRLVVASEAKEHQRIDIAMIKRMIGGDRLTGRRLHEDEQVFSFVGTLVMTGNELPRIIADDSFWAKFKPIPFENPLLDREDAEFESREIMPELPGILALLVRAHARLRASGYKMVDPPEVIALCAEQREEQNPVADFVRECVIPKKGDRVGTTPMREAYAAFCKRVGAHVMGDRALANALRELNLGQVTSHGLRYWKDVALKPPPQGSDQF